MAALFLNLTTYLGCAGSHSLAVRSGAVVESFIVLGYVVDL